MLTLPSAFTTASVGVTTVDAVASIVPSSSTSIDVSEVLLGDEPQAVSVMAKSIEITMCLRIRRS
jgi:hypothetical protein